MYEGISIGAAADTVIYDGCKIDHRWRRGENANSEITWGYVSRHLLIFYGSGTRKVREICIMYGGISIGAAADTVIYNVCRIDHRWRRGENANSEITWGYVSRHLLFF